MLHATLRRVGGLYPDVFCLLRGGEGLQCIAFAVKLPVLGVAAEAPCAPAQGIHSQPCSGWTEDRGTGPLQFSNLHSCLSAAPLWWPAAPVGLRRWLRLCAGGCAGCCSLAGLDCECEGCGGWLAHVSYICLTGQPSRSQHSWTRICCDNTTWTLQPQHVLLAKHNAGASRAAADSSLQCSCVPAVAWLHCFTRTGLWGGVFA